MIFRRPSSGYRPASEGRSQDLKLGEAILAIGQRGVSTLESGEKRLVGVVCRVLPPQFWGIMRKICQIHYANLRILEQMSGSTADILLSDK
jgi:hypothetical protein